MELLPTLVASHYGHSMFNSTEALRKLDSIHARELAVRTEELKISQERERIDLMVRMGLVEKRTTDEYENDSKIDEFTSVDWREISEVLDFWDVTEIKAVRSKVTRRLRRLLENGELLGQKMSRRTDMIATDPNDRQTYWVINSKSAIDFLDNPRFAKLVDAG